MALVLVLFACGPAREGGEPTPSASPVAGPPPDLTCPSSAAPSRFDFHNGFWLNLHNVLHREAKRRRGIRDESLGALGDAPEPDPVRAPTASEAAAWARALDHYDRVVLGAPRPDSAVIRINNRLARAGDRADLAGASLDAGLRSALMDAAPVYRETLWPVHRASNAVWIESMRGWLERWEGCLAPDLATALDARWPDGPVRVDATVYASWFGAYTTLDPPHVTISTTAVANRGSGGLESLLHEAGHVLLAPLEDALRREGVRSGRNVPRELSHLVLFYTAGHLVRRAVPSHATNAARFGIWDRNARAERFHRLLREEWRPRLEGRRSLTASVEVLLERSVDLRLSGR